MSGRFLFWLAISSLLAASLFLLGSHIWPADILLAQSDGIDNQQAERHLQMGQVYESAGEWDLALEEYKLASQAESDRLAEEARQGIERILAKQNSFWRQVGSDLGEFVTWLTSNSIKFLVVAALLFLLGRSILYLLDSRTSWTIMPFADLTKNDLGKAVSENIVGQIHEARLVHLNASTGMLGVSEEIDLPSVCAASYQEALCLSLQAMDSLDVSGIGLPVGSALAAMVRWLNMGQRHIMGTIEQRGQKLHLLAHMRKGRLAEISKVWSLSAPLNGDDLGLTLSELERDLVFHILYDTQDEWEASTPASLRLFTQALQSLRAFQVQPTVQEGTLQVTASLLEQALAVDPGYAAAKYYLAIAYHNLGEHQKAIEHLESLRAQPDHDLEFEIAYSLGIAHYHSMSYQGHNNAEKEFIKVVENIPETETDEHRRELGALARCGLVSVYAQIMHGQYQKMHPDAEDPEVCFERAQTLYKEAQEMANGKREILAVAHAARGLAFLNHGQASEAADEYEKAILLKPNYWRAYIHWGQAEQEKGNLDRAISCLEQAVALNPHYEFANYRLGFYLAEKARYEAAVEKRPEEAVKERYQQAVEALARAPSIVQAQDLRGQIRAEQWGQFEEALAAFEQILERRPSFTNALVNIAWYTLEAGYQDEERLERALECAQEALNRDRNTPNAWHRHTILGRVYLAQDRLEEARLELETAVQKQGRAQSYFFLAQVYLKLGDLAKAKECLVEFRKRRSRSPWYRKAYEEAGDLLRKIDEQPNADGG
jgi:tetratricopeptide (TPR) repeat protein